MNPTYYERFKIFTENRHWKKYLHWAYRACLEDLSKIDYYPDFSGEDFTALLCGTSGEVTSLHFVDFVLSKNRNAKILILDISESQIVQSKRVLTRAYPDANIRYIMVDAINTHLDSESINYIETDAFFEFFNLSHLNLLLQEWKRILKKGGWATTRAFASDTFIEKRLDFIRMVIAQRYLKVDIHIHHLDDITDAINKSGLHVVQGGGAYCPTFKRFSLLKIE